MGKQFRVNRQVGVQNVVAGGFVTFDLPRQYDCEAVFFRLTGQVQVTTGYTTVRAEAPTQAIARVELIADGKNTIYSAPFWNAVFAHPDRESMDNGAELATPPSGVAVATYNITATGVVDLQSPDTVRPKDSNFRTSGLQLWQARVSFGNPGDMFTGAGVSVFVGCTVECWVQECVELPDTAGVYTKPLMLKKVSYQEQAMPATTPNQEFRLPAGNLIRSLFLRTEISGEPSAAVLNAAQAFAGVDVRYNLKGAQIRGKAAHDYGRMSQVGYYPIDFLSTGKSDYRLTDLWDVTGQAEPKLSCDVVGSANTKAQVIVTEYIPIAQ
jgi:hypothetical protein